MSAAFDFSKLIPPSTVVRLAKALAPDVANGGAVKAIHRVLRAMTGDDIVAIARARGREIDQRGIDLQEPGQELKGTKPVVLYFGSEQDREEFIALVHEAKPGLVARKL
jgi:hypothetical protein